MDRTLIGIVLLAVGFAFLSGALLQVDTSEMEELGANGFSGIGYALRSGVQVQTQVALDSGGTLEVVAVYVWRAADPPTVYLELQLDCPGTTLWTQTEVWDQPSGSPPPYAWWFFDVPNRAVSAGDSCTVKLRASKAGLDATHTLGAWGLESFIGSGPYPQTTVLWGSPSAPTGPSYAGDTFGSSSASTAAASPEPPLEPPKPPDTGAWLILGILILIIILGTAVILIGVFG